MTKKNKSGIKKNIAGGSNNRRARQGAVVPMMKGGVVKMAGGGMSSPGMTKIAGPGVKPDRSVRPQKPRVGVGGKPMKRVGQRPIGNNPPIKKMAKGGKSGVKKMGRGGKLKKMGRGGKLKK